MSFTLEDVLEEFAEASRYGETNHTERYAAWAESRWWHEIGFQTLRPKTEIKPLAVETVTCPRCGRDVERREGTTRLVHKGTGGCSGSWTRRKT